MKQLVTERLTVTIEIRGEDAGSPLEVLKLIARRVDDGYAMGFDRNEDSSYRYEVERKQRLVDV